MKKFTRRRGKATGMNVPMRKSWTQDEFFSWAGAQEGRYEFDGFQPVAMTGGTINHGVISQNVQAALRDRLKGSGCRALGPDNGVATIGTAIRYPDALVTCAKLTGSALAVPGVAVVFEVLSPGSSRTDRIVKLREYAAVGSIRRYVIVESASRDLTVMERQGSDEVWRITTLAEDDTLRMPEIGIEIPVADFYEDVDFGDGVAASS